MEEFTPDVRLERDEQAHLASIFAMPGFKVLHKLMKSEIDKLFLAHINAPVEDKEKIVERYRLAKAAAIFFSQITDRVNQELNEYAGRPKKTDRPIDITEGILDLGDVPNTVEDDGYSWLNGEER